MLLLRHLELRRRLDRALRQARIPTHKHYRIYMYTEIECSLYVNFALPLLMPITRELDVEEVIEEGRRR